MITPLKIKSLFSNFSYQNKRKGHFKIIVFLIAIITFNFYISNYTANAVANTSSNDNYNINTNEVDIDPENPQPTSASIHQIDQTETPVVNQIEQDTKVIVNNSSISFLSDTELIDFGPLSPGNPITRKASLSITAYQTNYTVFAFEDHPLIESSGASVPDTTCEDGQCNEATESPWTNTLTYGFGFRCDNTISSSCLGFTQPNTYKQFTDYARQEKLEAIISDAGNTKEESAEITFRLNVSGTQKQGSYNNNITFIAVPNF